ncbi:hypothetical protein CYY_005016 [Polysphondylium violaceum]|uniref:Chitin-binding type-4 domain-containing protein n=1 Tax=Polysphondylium violaceum TaxID=133409 RepID=A0A8J4USI7_9MYCE|nr:hypothetical protein CYY_005016 [Polysphondylium violaceum]
MKNLTICLLILSIISFTNGHGYGVGDLMSRQIKCTTSPSFSIWWPEDGTGIANLACRAAYQHVATKTGSADAARYQFVQKNEYSVLIPNYAAGYSALTAAVPDSLCSAHAVNNAVQFGDKSGMSIPNNWLLNTITVPSTSTASKDVVFEFCATAAHNPSFWEFYVTNSGFNIQTSNLTWSDLTLIHSTGDNLPVTNTNANCEASKAYKIPITLPARYQGATLLVRWQRVDPVGECFINCSDFIFSV